jgi:hypothetical protein
MPAANELSRLTAAGLEKFKTKEFLQTIKNLQ